VSFKNLDFLLGRYFIVHTLFSIYKTVRKVHHTCLIISTKPNYLFNVSSTFSCLFSSLYICQFTPLDTTPPPWSRHMVDKIIKIYLFFYGSRSTKLLCEGI
jgi:hypothetical protein